jgi:hypothetical protein
MKGLAKPMLPGVSEVPMDTTPINKQSGSLKTEQRKAYWIIVNHLKDYMDRKKPEQLLISNSENNLNEREKCYASSSHPVSGS